MESREPATSPNEVDAFDGQAESVASIKHFSDRFGRWRRTVGLLMIAVVIFLWTASNFLASAVLADDTYSKPYFLTYYNTAFFILPLIPALAWRAHRDPDELRQWKEDSIAWIYQSRNSGKRRLSNAKGDHNKSQGARRLSTIPESHEPLLDTSTRADDDSIMNGLYNDEKPDHRLTLSETTRLSFEFCMLWFLANYFIGASLQFTTVGSSTILTSTSSIFTLIFGVMARVEKFTLRKLIGILASLAGIVMISSIDLSGSSTDDEHRGDFPEKTLGEIAVGDIMAVLAALVYGLYSVLVKKRIADESAVNMPLFFGLVGVINVLFLWPGFLLLHWTGIERFEMPDSSRTTLIITLNAVASLVADLAWAYAVLLTSPIVVTVGLSMTIPLSLLGEHMLNSQTASPLYWVGALVVVLSFVLVNHEERKDEQSQHLATHGILARDTSLANDN